MHRRALLVVDVQRDFCPGGSLAVPDGNEIVPVINRLTEREFFDGGILFSKDWHPNDHISFATNHENRRAFETIVLPNGMEQTLWPRHCVQGTEGAKFEENLVIPKDGYIIHKGKDNRYDSYSTFCDNVRASQTELQTLLKERQVQQLYICGLALDVCVLFSALDAIDLGFRPTIILDACRGLSEASNEKAITKMENAGVEFITSDAICPEL